MESMEVHGEQMFFGRSPPYALRVLHGGKIWKENEFLTMESMEVRGGQMFFGRSPLYALRVLHGEIV